MGLMTGNHWTLRQVRQLQNMGTTPWNIVWHQPSTLGNPSKWSLLL